MAAVDAGSESTKKKGILKPLLIGSVLALAGGGIAFFLIFSGIAQLPIADPGNEKELNVGNDTVSGFAYLPLDPMVIPLGKASGNKNLRFTAQLEVPKETLGHVETFKPRIVDVLNTYLRAVDLEDLQEPSSLLKLRAHMVYRILAIVGPGQINDLLIMELVVI